MAFKGSVYRTPPARKRKWYQRQPQPVPAQLHLHLNGVVLTFDSKEDFKRFAERRVKDLRK